jgi:tetratricopeptide (TPR) repeat protein
MLRKMRRLVRLQSSSLFQIGARRLGYFLLGWLMLGVAAGHAQENGRDKADEAVVRGVVLTPEGSPVEGAVVRLDGTSPDGQSAVSTAAGEFVFASVRKGSHRIVAEKGGKQSGSQVINAEQTEQIRLILNQSVGMEFSDDSKFTVAGITDWTSVGGHGSDATLRTSESLARETAVLKPGASIGASAAATQGTAEARLKSTVSANPQSFEANHQLGEFYCHAERYREAIPFLETANRMDSTNTRNSLDLAIAYERSGDLTHAVEQVQKLVARAETADLHRVLGDLYEQSGDSLGAVREYERAVQLDPSEPNYFAWGSELLLHRAIWPAGEVFRTGTERFPKSPRMQAALGAALFAAAQYEEAAQHLCIASDLNRRNLAPYLLLGEIDMAAPTPSSCAESMLARGVQEHPDDARVYFYDAMAVLKRRPESANRQVTQKVEDLLRKAVAINSKYGEAYLQLGNLYFDRDLEKATAFYKSAVEAMPRYGEAHYRLGLAYERLGEPAKAKSELELHDEIEREQAADIESQRQHIKQFMIVLKGQSAPSPTP